MAGWGRATAAPRRPPPWSLPPPFREFTKGVPHEWFTYLREHRPVFHHPEPRGPGFWVVSKHADVQAVSRDPVTYSSDQDRGGVVPLAEPEVAIGRPGAKVLIAMDPPEHTRYRKLVNRGFTPRMINALEPRIREMAVRILDRAIAKGTCDFVVDVAAEFPVEVIAELLGMPERRAPEDLPLDEPGARRGGRRRGGSRVLHQRLPSRASADGDVLVRPGALCEERRKEPRDDIMSELLRAELYGQKLTEFELAAFFMFLSAAGNETTVA
jgi:cholest-4-en-3-one 26-monooxygenase